MAVSAGAGAGAGAVIVAPLAVWMLRDYPSDVGSSPYGGRAAHQIGAAIAATGSAIVRDRRGTYNAAWYTAGILCLIATVLAMLVRAPGAASRRWRLTPGRRLGHLVVPRCPLSRWL